MVITVTAPQSFCSMSVASRVCYNHLFRNASFATSSTTTDKSSTMTSIPKSVLAVERAPSAFMVFRKEQYAVVKKESPSANVLEILKNKWESLASTKKEDYAKKAAGIKKGLMEKQKGVEKMRKQLAEFVKRPPSAFDVFRKEKFTSVPGKTAVDRMPKLAAEWKNLKTDQKQKYLSKADALKKEFEKRRSGLTDEQKNALTELRVERGMNKVKRLGRINRVKELGELAANYGRPKMPETAFLLFRSEVWSSLGEGPVVSRMQTVASKWNALPPATKQKYVDKARTSMEKYKKDLTAWEQKMVASGQKEMVEKFHKVSFRAFIPANVKVPVDERRKAMVAMREKLRAKRAATRQRDLKKAMAQKAKRALLRERKAKLESKKKARMTSVKAKNAAIRESTLKKIVERREQRKAKLAALRDKKNRVVLKKKAQIAMIKAKRENRLAAKKAQLAAQKEKQQKQMAMKKAKMEKQKAKKAILKAKRTAKGKNEPKKGKATKKAAMKVSKTSKKVSAKPAKKVLARPMKKPTKPAPKKAVATTRKVKAKTTKAK